MHDFEDSFVSYSVIGELDKLEHHRQALCPQDSKWIFLRYQTQDLDSFLDAPHTFEIGLPDTVETIVHH